MAVVDPPATPSPALLGDHAVRHLAGLALLVLAAVLVHRGGYLDQQWQYAAMASALAPQVLIDLWGARNPERRGRLRVSRRPVLLLTVMAASLAAVAVWAWSAHQATPVVVAASLGAAGLAVAAAPPSVHLTGRR